MFDWMGCGCAVPHFLWQQGLVLGIRFMELIFGQEQLSGHGCGAHGTDSAFREHLRVFDRAADGLLI